MEFEKLAPTEASEMVQGWGREASPSWEHLGTSVRSALETKFPCPHPGA